MNLKTIINRYSKKNRRLRKAKEFMSSVPPHMFNMAMIRSRFTDRSSAECGSIGCIIGWCTALDKENVEKNYRRGYFDIIDFTRWSKDYFSIEDQNEWDYLFSGLWAEWKEFNTIEHAQYRIQKIIDGYKPENMDIEIMLELNK